MKKTVTYADVVRGKRGDKEENKLIDLPYPSAGDLNNCEKGRDSHEFVLIQVKWTIQTVSVLDRLVATTIEYPEVYCRRIIVVLLESNNKTPTIPSFKIYCR